MFGSFPQSCPYQLNSHQKQRIETASSRITGAVLPLSRIGRPVPFIGHAVAGHNLSAHPRQRQLQAAFRTFKSADVYGCRRVVLGAVWRGSQSKSGPATGLISTRFQPGDRDGEAASPKPFQRFFSGLAVPENNRKLQLAQGPLTPPLLLSRSIESLTFRFHPLCGSRRNSRHLDRVPVDIDAMILEPVPIWLEGRKLCRGTACWVLRPLFCRPNALRCLLNEGVI